MISLSKSCVSYLETALSDIIHRLCTGEGLSWMPCGPHVYKRSNSFPIFVHRQALLLLCFETRPRILGSEVSEAGHRARFVQLQFTIFQVSDREGWVKSSVSDMMPV